MQSASSTNETALYISAPLPGGSIVSDLPGASTFSKVKRDLMQKTERSVLTIGHEADPPLFLVARNTTLKQRLQFREPDCEASIRYQDFGLA